jgi:hypothetical protein
MRVSRLTAAAGAFAGIAAIAVPAASQPGDPYTYRSPGEQIMQGVIDSLLGNRYNVTDRRAVRRCSDAALAEAWDEFGPRRWGRGDARWGRRDWRNHQMRVVAITDVDRRSAGLRVRGEIDSGLLYAQQWPGQRARGDLTFRCNVDYNGRVFNVRVDRNRDFRPPRPY